MVTAEGYQMSEYSSWGVPGDLALKPEITAPGENIYSTVNGGGYGCMSGTFPSRICAALSGFVTSKAQIDHVCVQQQGILYRRHVIIRKSHFIIRKDFHNQRH